MFARHRNMAHPLSRLCAESLDDQLVIAPHGAIKEHQSGTRQARFEIVGHVSAGGQEIEVLAAALVQNPKSQRIACAITAHNAAWVYCPPFSRTPGT